MKNNKINNKKILLSIVIVVVVVATILIVAVNFFHIDFVHEKQPIAITLDEDNILSGDGSEDNPITPIKTPEVIKVGPRLFPWNENNTEFIEYRHKIYDQTLDVSLEYLSEYGQKTAIDYKFVKGSPNTLTYKLCGADDGSEYIVTINFKDKNNPTVTYEKS